jgi:hypothetical protein
MASNNRLWGAERIRGELLKLGIRVCKRTIQKYMRQVYPVLATCGIRQPKLASEDTSCCLLLLADSSKEEYNLKH